MRDIVVAVKLKCRRCGHAWRPRQKEVRMCPKCKTPWWDKRRT
jgi:predicted Zn-ribbon and HTH transcriptional regulator